MSTGEKVPREYAISEANKIMRLLSPVCERIEIAGSLRRGKLEVGDIEIVCIPNTMPDLFGNQTVNEFGIYAALHNRTFIKNGERYKQIALGRINCDLFITTKEQWGVIFLIRTGSADFSRRMVTPIRYGGYMPSYLNVKDGRLWNGETVIETPEEIDVFNAYNMDFVPPNRRVE